MRRARDRQVDAAVALAILEELRAADRPEEYLEDEDLTITLPRRLGLSDVVGRGIRRYDADVRRGRRVSESEVADLVALVARRGDADELFHGVGRSLAERDPARGLLRRVAHRGLRMRLARREVKRRLRKLFGPGVARFEKGAFNLVGLDVPFLEADPGGEVGEIVTGLCEKIVQDVTAERVTIRRSRSVADGGYRDQWMLGDDGADGARHMEAPRNAKEIDAA